MFHSDFVKLGSEILYYIFAEKWSFVFLLRDTGGGDCIWQYLIKRVPTISGFKWLNIKTVSSKLNTNSNATVDNTII